MGKIHRINFFEVEKLKVFFHRHIGKTLLLGKTTQAIEGAFLVAADAVNVPYRTFLFFNTIGTLPKSLILLLYGYYFGKEYARVSDILDYIGLATIVLFVGVFLIFRKKIVSLLHESK